MKMNDTLQSLDIVVVTLMSTKDDIIVDYMYDNSASREEVIAFMKRLHGEYKVVNIAR